MKIRFKLEGESSRDDEIEWRVVQQPGTSVRQIKIDSQCGVGDVLAGVSHALEPHGNRPGLLDRGKINHYVVPEVLETIEDIRREQDGHADVLGFARVMTLPFLLLVGGAIVTTFCGERISSDLNFEVTQKITYLAFEGLAVSLLIKINKDLGRAIESRREQFFKSLASKEKQEVLSRIESRVDGFLDTVETLDYDYY